MAKKELRATISSLVVEPMQRTTRYPLLIKELIKSFKKSNDTKNLDSLKTALSEVEEIAKYANLVQDVGKMKDLPVSYIL